VNLITGYDGIQFTISIWGPSKDDEISYDKVSIEKSDFLPFLDMKMYWNGSDNLTFDVYHKEGQQIKYLHHNSTHPPHIFKVIKTGVFQCLATLISMSEVSENAKMSSLHPVHHQALVEVGLISAEASTPSLQSILLLKTCTMLLLGLRRLK
jgi:hypothetical protein